MSAPDGFAQLVVAALEDAKRDPKLRARLVAALDELTAEPVVPAGYTTVTLATQLGVTTKVITGAIRRGELEAQRRGRRWVIAAAAVDAWLSPSARPGRRDTSRRTSRRRRTTDGTLAALVDSMPCPEVSG
jgi:excisionase family DNA binding protein